MITVKTQWGGSLFLWQRMWTAPTACSLIVLIRYLCHFQSNMCQIPVAGTAVWTVALRASQWLRDFLSFRQSLLQMSGHSTDGFIQMHANSPGKVLKAWKKQKRQSRNPPMKVDTVSRVNSTLNGSDGNTYYYVIYGKSNYRFYLFIIYYRIITSAIRTEAKSAVWLKGITPVIIMKI